MNRKKKTSFFPCHTIAEALTVLYLVTFVLLLILGLGILFLTGFSVNKLAIFMILSGIYLIALIFAVLLSKSVPAKQRTGKYKKLLKNCKKAQISSLCEQTGWDKEDVLRDLQLLIQRGVFPDGYLSEDQKYFYPEQEKNER